MTEAHMLDRAERAQRIIDDPDNFKVCEGCDSIVVASVDLCPNCNSYRYNDDPLEVVIHARELASRPQQSVTIWDLE